MNKFKLINNYNLKLIAALLMLIDHIGVVLYPNILILRYIGRLSFPIFAFFISEGFYYTKSKKKYLLKLLIFAIVTEPIFDLTFYDKLFYINHQNVLFSFFLSVLFLILYDKLRNNKKLYEIAFFFPQLFLFLLFMIISTFCFVDYYYYGFILVVLFYFLRNRKTLRFFLISIYQLITLRDYNIFSILSNIILIFYNGKKGCGPKYFFYIFYPFHLFILFIIKKLMS